MERISQDRGITDEMTLTKAAKPYLEFLRERQNGSHFRRIIIEFW